MASHSYFKGTNGDEVLVLRTILANTASTSRKIDEAGRRRMNFIAGEILGGCGVLVAAPPMQHANSAGRSVY
jgi:hypothetical protein